MREHMVDSGMRIHDVRKTAGGLHALVCCSPSLGAQGKHIAAPAAALHASTDHTAVTCKGGFFVRYKYETHENSTLSAAREYIIKSYRGDDIGVEIRGSRCQHSPDGDPLPLLKPVQSHRHGGMEDHQAPFVVCTKRYRAVQQYPRHTTRKLTCRKYRPSVHMRAFDEVTSAVPADPVKPVSHSLLLSWSATYSLWWASCVSTRYAESPCSCITSRSRSSDDMDADADAEAADALSLLPFEALAMRAFFCTEDMAGSAQRHEEQTTARRVRGASSLASSTRGSGIRHIMYPGWFWPARVGNLPPPQRSGARGESKHVSQGRRERSSLAQGRARG